MAPKPLWRDTNRLGRFAVAIAAVAVALLLRFALDPWLGGRAHYLLFTAAVLVAGVFGGAVPAIVAALLSGAVVQLVDGVDGTTGFVELGAFLATSAVLIWTAAHIKRLRARSADSERTAEQRADEARTLSDELNLLIDGATGYAIYMLDLEGRVAIWNKSAERMKGWSAQEVIGQSSELFYGPVARAEGKPRRDLERARAAGKLEEEDWRVRKDGSEFLAHVTITPLYDSSGRPRGYGKVIRDVTEQRAWERQLSASANQFRSILATVPDAMIVIDDAGRILSFSAAAERLFECSEAEVKGRNVSMLMPSPDRERHDQYLSRYLSTGEPRIIGTGRVVIGQRSDGTTAVAGAAIVTLTLATRPESHWLIERLNERDVRSFARYAVIALAVLPFLPNRRVGPLEAWNPFQLWLVVVLVTGFSFSSYVASRALGPGRGILATALIGGAYSSTAVTASFAQHLHEESSGLFIAGIVTASAVMYLRVIVLVAMLAPFALPAFLAIVLPAAIVAGAASVILWLPKSPTAPGAVDAPGNPVELLPAVGFALMVALAAIATRWAQLRFGQRGIATSLFFTGSFDVDAAVVTLSGLPRAAIAPDLAALALGATIVANMTLKLAIVIFYGRKRGAGALVALTASLTILIVTLLWPATALGALPLD